MRYDILNVTGSCKTPLQRTRFEDIFNISSSCRRCRATHNFCLKFVFFLLFAVTFTRVFCYQVLLAGCQAMSPKSHSFDAAIFSTASIVPPVTDVHAEPENKMDRPDRCQCIRPSCCMQ